MAKQSKQVIKGVVAVITTDDKTGAITGTQIFTVDQLNKIDADIVAQSAARKSEIDALIAVANAE